MDLVTRLRFALYRYGGHIPPCPGRPCECGFQAEWKAAELPETFGDAMRIAQLKALPPLTAITTDSAKEHP